MAAVEPFQPAWLGDLRRPFTAAAVRFKPQTWNTDRRSGIAIAYIDARLVVERLNRVVGLDWHDEYERIDARSMLCRLTVSGTTREDAGEAAPDAAGGVKALYSDALKRAAVKFGVGMSIYALPKMQLTEADVWMRKDRKTGEIKPGGLKDAGEQRLRGVYQRWLETRGVDEFGEPLDHGDTADSIGDAADDAPQTITEPASTLSETLPARTNGSKETADEQTLLEVVKAGIRAISADNTPTGELRGGFIREHYGATLGKAAAGIIADYGEKARDLAPLVDALMDADFVAVATPSEATPPPRRPDAALPFDDQPTLEVEA